MDWTGAILIVLLFILAIMFLLKRGSSRNNSSPNLPPGPRTIPILGNLHMIDLKRLHKTMIEWSKEYGPIFRIKLGFQEMVVLTGYETVKEALVNQADVFADRPFIPIFQDATKGFGDAEDWIAKAEDKENGAEIFNTNFETPFSQVLGQMDETLDLIDRTCFNEVVKPE